VSVVTYLFRTIEDPTVESRPRNSPFADANLFLGGRMYSIVSRGGEVTVEDEAEVGVASACAVVTTALVPGAALVPFYAEFTFHEGAVYAAEGTAQVTSADVPEAGVVLAGCALRVVSGPPGCSGGAATSLSIFNPAGAAGVGTGSFWTLRAYLDADEAVTSAR
jgi:hypothetical protein